MTDSFYTLVVLVGRLACKAKAKEGELSKAMPDAIHVWLQWESAADHERLPRSSSTRCDVEVPHSRPESKGEGATRLGHRRAQDS